ncbi:hypothetical protein nbrc107696_07800 [Gordonia spumicola]|uniref:Class F sortase n=1 Tax=Gordonia spumicola TaxID=589161 RepID=A0A7I9V579_9ACTN|nr:class F sortase [Gordonia spumicola]GEE00334.1 hypothetical protein nbrc107696_07800 [Gordonia spumicola]
MKTTVRTVAVALLAGLAALLFLTGCASGGSTAPAPPAPARVLSGDTAAKPATVDAPIGTPDHITIPDVGVDANVAPISDTGSEIDPPSNDDAYWWTQRGKPGSNDTVYLAGHTLDNGTGVFAAVQRSKPGEKITIDTSAGKRTYRITATAAYAKADLDRYDDVWAAVPGRLILVTCHLDNGAPTNDNFLVFATLIS